MNNTDKNLSPPLLSLKGICKSFPDIKASDEVTLNLNRGEIHALLGENGAGKSTLVKIIYGIIKPDSGEMTWMGNPTTITNPAMARDLGIAMVFQHFSLFESMSTLENIALGMNKTTQLDSLEQQIVSVSEHYGLPLNPDRHVYTLSVGERQRIEIVRCLLQNPKLLIMDEPTSVLTPQEVRGLFETLQQLIGEGVTVLYISHKLSEIKALCKTATILRNGRVVDSVLVRNETAASLAEKMMGEELSTIAKTSAIKQGRICLQLSNLSQKTQDQFGINLHDINITVSSGEIVGIAGIAGNGQDELLRAINGETRTEPGESVRINKRACARLSPNQRRHLGLASIPEKRLGHAAVPDMSLVNNAFLTSFQRLKLTVSGLIRYSQCEIFCRKIVDQFKVKTPSIHARASSLSGGNLQKFIVGREINQQPIVLVVSQPTWGVDTGSAQAIHHALRQLAEQGSAILIISHDLDELMLICDRIAAICGGRLSEAIEVEKVTTEKIGLLMTGVGLQSDCQQVAP